MNLEVDIQKETLAEIQHPGVMVGRYPRGTSREHPGDRAFDREPLEESLGRAVRSRRTEIGMTQTRLAELSGMTQAAISRLEHGKCMPTFPLLERIASAFGSPLHVSIEPGRGVTASFGGMGEPEERSAGGMGGLGARGGRLLVGERAQGRFNSIV